MGYQYVGRVNAFSRYYLLFQSTSPSCTDLGLLLCSILAGPLTPLRTAIDLGLLVRHALQGDP